MHSKQIVMILREILDERKELLNYLKDQIVEEFERRLLNVSINPAPKRID